MGKKKMVQWLRYEETREQYNECINDAIIKVSPNFKALKKDGRT